MNLSDIKSKILLKKSIYFVDYKDYFLWGFAGLGLLSLLAVLSLCWMFRGLDSGASTVYWNMAKTLSRTGSVGDATTWKVAVSEDVSIEDVEESLKAIAAELNIKDVGQLPLGDQVAAMTGKKWRTLKIYQYCQPLVAKSMIDYSESFSAFLPCRISLVSDKKGKLWLYSANMDMMIHGGNTLPPALLKEANGVKKIMLALMNRAAKGDF